MCLLFETIRIDNGKPRYLSLHLERMNRSRSEIWKTIDAPFVDSEFNVPDELSTGLVRCNIRYGSDIKDITYNKYHKRTIRSLKMVTCDSIDYHLKYTDRKNLEYLFGQRGNADEILIIKDGFITDTSISNIIFYTGSRWITPAKPLLKGTCRERLVKTGFISEYDIKPADLESYQGCKLINAMRYLEEDEMIPMTSVGW